MPAREAASSALRGSVARFDHSPELARRADSLVRLNPTREARAAIARGDLRFLAFCTDACRPVGVPLDSAISAGDRPALQEDSTVAIAGTSDAIINGDMARLDSVAGAYAARYNQVIWHYRARSHRAERARVTPSP